MKRLLSKTSLLAGIGVYLFAASTEGYSQRCGNFNYGGCQDWGYSRCEPSNSGYGYGYNYDGCRPQYRNNCNNGGYYGRGCSPRMARNYNYGNSYGRQGYGRQACPGCPMCNPSQSSSSATSIPAPAPVRENARVEERLSYVEAVLNFILKKLGLLDEFEDSREVAPTYSRPSRSSGGSCAGGT